jgi:hypothetical protein
MKPREPDWDLVAIYICSGLIVILGWLLLQNQ